MTYPLRQLADVFGAPGPWSTAYVDARHDTEDAPHAGQLRWRAVRQALTDRGAPEEDLAALDAAVAAPTEIGGEACRYLLAGQGRVVLDEVMPGAPVGPDVAVHGALPDVLPLVLHRLHEVPYVVVEAGREGAHVSAHCASRPTTVAEHDVAGETDRMRKVQAGGWSHRRYQQHAEEVWARNAAAVAEDVARTVQQTGADVVVLAGDVRARELLTDSLPPGVRSLLVQVDVHTRAPGADHGALDSALHEHLDDKAEAEERHLLDRLATKAGEGQRTSAVGLGATVDALRQGQVETLLLDPAALDGRHLLALEAAPWVAIAPDEATGAEVLAEVPATQALLRAGALTDADVLVVDAERLARPDGVAALLRWPVGPGAS